MQNTTKIIAGVLVAVLLLAGGFIVLSNNDDEDDNNNQNAPTVQLERSDEFPLNISLSNLERLIQGIYEGWIVRGDMKHSFGTFNMSESGQIDGEFSLDGVTPQNGDTVAISIEPDNDTDPEPSATIILAGEMVDGSANLAFPLDISGFSGTYILATPTTETKSDETSGIWFTSTGSDATLNIPVAPAGWIYEGWVVVDGLPVTSGQFTDPNQADNFDGYSGPGNAPNKPGEDYVANLPSGFDTPIELADGTSMIVVSIEPFQNGEDPTGSTPAQVKPLSAAIAEGATDHTEYDLEQSSSSLPSGTVTL